MGLSAMTGGEAGLEALDGAVPDLAGRARRVARELETGDAGAELMRLLGPAPESRLRERWVRVPSEIRPLPGLRRLVQVLVMPAQDEAAIPEELAPLTGELLNERLATLSIALLRLAAGGVGWARSTAALGARRQGRASSRAAPAVAWIARAYADDEDGLDALAATWPAALAEVLLRCRGDAGRATAAPKPAPGELGARLRKELEALG